MYRAKEYLQKAGLAETHWGERIILAEENGYFSRFDIKRANNWVDCACGKCCLGPEQRGEYTNYPKDDELRKEGEEFGEVVKAGDFVEAAHILHRIETLAVEIMRNAK